MPIAKKMVDYFFLGKNNLRWFIQLWGMIFFLVLSVSCKTTKDYYFFSSLNSTNLDQNTKGYLASESDKYRIMYRVTGLNLTLKVIIENKTNSPIYIDWRKSTINVNDFEYKSIADMPGSLFSKQDKSIIQPLSIDSFDLIRSGYFDMKIINRRKLKKENAVVLNKQTQTKSIFFDYETSPLVIAPLLFIDEAGNHMIVKKSLFIDKVSMIDKKMYKRAKSNYFEEMKGFYSFYTNKKKSALIVNNVFKQLITTTIYSLICNNGKIVTNLDDCFDD